VEARAGMEQSLPCWGVVEERDDGWNVGAGGWCTQETENLVEAAGSEGLYSAEDHGAEAKRKAGPGRSPAPHNLTLLALHHLVH
jgi:hypothetical protein